MKSFKAYQHLRILTKNGTVADGDYILEGITVRITKGFLNDVKDRDGNILPAVETHDGNHVEHWENGVLHCEDSPAVVDNEDNYEEWFINGTLVPSDGGQK